MTFSGSLSSALKWAKGDFHLNMSLLVRYSRTENMIQQAAAQFLFTFVCRNEQNKGKKARKAKEKESVK